MRAFASLLGAAVLVGALAPATLANGRNPGSVLIYTVQRSGPEDFTVISVTNSNTTPMTPNSFGGSVGLHYEYANVVENTDPLDPDAPFLPLNCVVFNRHEFLTPADHLSVVTACHNAVSPGGQEGFLVVSAEDPAQFDVAVDHDDLMGSELVINASGGMYSINAIPFEGLPETICDDGREGDDCQDPLFVGGPTDLNNNGALDFDDFEYEPIPDVLSIDSYIALAGSQLALLSLTGSPSDVNTVQFTVWNDNEFALSSTRVFKCWFDQPLDLVSPLFEESFLKNSTPHDPSELALVCGSGTTVETGWARIDSVDVSSMGGLPVSSDGALLGSISAGPTSVIDGARLLWESQQTQTNGRAFAP